jgi:uncharacterized protein
VPSRSRADEAVFVDTGAWVALAVELDPLHARAIDAWERILSSGARIMTSVPIVLETFTFLQRNTRLDVALSWKDRMAKVPRIKILECTTKDVHSCWDYLKNRDLHKLSAVDATSFVLMKRERIRTAFAYDHHFAAVGFRLIG